MTTTLGSRPQGVLRVISGPSAGQSLAVSRELLIGRENADLVIPDPEVSRRHAALRPAPDGVMIEDLGSSNGTFVNGVRISGAVTLTEPGRLRIGDSEMAVEIQTEPQLETTRVRPVVPDDATRIRPVAEDRTAAAPVTPPAPPSVAPQPSEPIPAAEQSVPTSPPSGSEPLPKPRGPWARVPGLVAAIAAVAIAVFVIISTNGSSAKTRPVSGTLTTVLLREIGPNALFAGIVTANPGGSGSVTIDQVYGGPLVPHGKPVPVTARIALRFDDGAIDSTIQATAVPQPTGSVHVNGRGRFVGGTGKYKGATGSFDFSGGRAKLQVPIALFHMNGTIKY